MYYFVILLQNRHINLHTYYNIKLLLPNKICHLYFCFSTMKYLLHLYNYVKNMRLYVLNLMGCIFNLFFI